MRFIGRVAWKGDAELDTWHLSVAQPKTQPRRVCQALGVAEAASPQMTLF